MQNTERTSQGEAVDFSQKHLPLRLFFILLILVWSVSIAASLWYNVSQLTESAHDAARLQARTAYEKDIMYRRWNSKHNGVFVPVVPGEFDPNPYLKPEGREVEGTDGRLLTKINPAYMTRLVHEIGALNSGVLGHITSNMPIRPGNEPDAWESAALEKLEKGEAVYVSEVHVLDGKEYMRFMGGLTTEESCMPCHRHQGYQVGDIRGGISVAAPMAPFLEPVAHQKNILYATHFGLWLLGSIGLLIGGRRLMQGVDERDLAVREMRKSKDAAERANRSKSDFLANMSHEIRTPLNGVIGMADLILRTRLTPDQASMAAAIKTSGDSLLVVLNDILDISKIEAGKLALEKTSFLLRDMLFDAVKGLTPIAYKKNVELILHISPEVPDHVVGDPQRLRQIVLNLVNNALKFTEEGEVVVTAQMVASSDDEATVRISITDTGIGIPAEKQASIFKAFEQADTSTTRKYGGTGLGLAICTSLLALMGTKLELKSHEGFGSSFWFDVSLPLDKDGVAPKPLVSTEALQGVPVLIVDDNDTNLLILNETLTGWGMEVKQAKSADDGFALAKVAADSKRPFRVILSDLQMPEKDGVDLLRMVRKDHSVSMLPIILLTSGNLPIEIQSETGQPGFFDAVLDKPVRPERLMRAIASSLNIWESYDVQEIQREEESIKIEEIALNILLVEDVEMNQMVAKRMLSELGHTVKVVGDGQQALDAIKVGDKFDVILMDIQMPVMDGIQATHAIREMEKNGELPDHNIIVAMTANALKGDKEKYLAIGMDSYLAKPILLEDLRNVLTDLFTEKEAETESHVTANMELTWTNVALVTHGKEMEQPAPESTPVAGQEQPDAAAGAEEIPAEQAEPQAEAGSMIDWELLERSFAGSRDFMVDSMSLYLRDAPRLLQDVENAAARSDNGGLTTNAHALKGITGYFTRAGAYELCLELEEAGRENRLPGDAVNVQNKLHALSAQVDRLINEMNEYIRKGE